MLIHSTVLFAMALCGEPPSQDRAAEHARSIALTAQERHSYTTSWAKATAVQRNTLIGHARSFLTPPGRRGPATVARYGTAWDFNGSTRIPGQGQIACG